MTTYRYRGGTRLITWLVQKDPDAALALYRYGKVPYSPEAANDNVHTFERETGIDIDEETPGKPSIEFLHETKPTIEYMREECERSGVVVVDGCRTTIGELVFDCNPVRREQAGASGLMVSYKTVKRNGEDVPVAPKVETLKPRGGKTQKRVVYAPKPDMVTVPTERTRRKLGYLDLRGVPVEHRPAAIRHAPIGMPDKPKMESQSPEDELAMARAIKNAKMLAAAYANTPVLPPVQKCPTAIARGSVWLGGLVGAKGNSSKGAIPLAQRYERPELSEATARVLEDALSNETFATIGIRLGYNGRYADKAGKRAFLDAVASLVANDNGQLQEKAA